MRKRVPCSLQEIINRHEKKLVTKEGADRRGSSSSNGLSFVEQGDGVLEKDATVTTSFTIGHSDSMSCSSTLADIGDSASMYENNKHVRQLGGISGHDVPNDDLDAADRDGNAYNACTEEVGEWGIGFDDGQ